MRPEFNQPKLYTKLLSKPNGRDYAVYSMVTLDEITRRTPDALMTGEATKRIISHCCPDLIEPGKLLSCDIQHLLSTIQLASGGSKIEFFSSCPKCYIQNSYEMQISSMINSLSTKLWSNPLIISGDQQLKIFFEPRSYQDFIDFSIADFRFKKQIYQITKLESIDGYEEMLSSLASDQRKLQLNFQLGSVCKIIIDDCVMVDEKKYISEWLNQLELQIQNQITNYIELAEKQSNVPEINISCNTCGNKYCLPIDLDFSNQFRNKLIRMDETEIIHEIEHMGKETKQLSDDLLKLIWYMRGSISYSEAIYLTNDEKTAITKIIEENIETSKKCGFPVI